jgi:hypothetical protein
MKFGGPLSLAISECPKREGIANYPPAKPFPISLRLAPAIACLDLRPPPLLLALIVEYLSLLPSLARL